MTVKTASGAESLPEPAPGSPKRANFMSMLLSSWRHYLLLFVASTSWMFFSSALILLNKYLMVSDGFRYPMALTGMGMAFSSIASFFACKVFQITESTQVMTWKFYALRLLPVGLFLALTLTLGNWVYLYLTVAFIQMLKAFTPIITMLMTFVVGLEQPQRSLVASILTITGGVGLAAYGELNFSLLGVGIMFSTQIAESARLVMTQTLLQGCKFSAFEGLMYTAPACVFWLVIGFFLLEYQTMMQTQAWQKVLDKPLIYLSSAAMGFLMHLTAYLTLKLSGSLTLKVLGTVKNSLIVLSGVLLFGESVSRIQFEGYVISVIGFFMYNHAKMKAQAERHTNMKTQKEDEEGKPLLSK